MVLDPFIIEEIQRREREREERQRLPLELPLYEDPPMDSEASPPPEENDRGVVIIDL